MMYSNVRICPACGGVTTVYWNKETDNGFKRYRKCNCCKFTFQTYEIMVEELGRGE